jgi:Disaggregatase related
MLRVSVSLAIIALASTLDASAATYYVDQSAGADSNTGTSETSPWKNSPGMTSYSGSGILRPGDTVYFDRADTWLVTGGQGLYLVGGVTYVGDSWGTGTRATIRANGNLDAGVVRFRDHATIATIFKGFDVDANHTVSTGIDINHRLTSLMNGATKRVENNVVHGVKSSQSSGQYKYGIIASNFGGANGYAENIEIVNNVVHDISRDGICLYPGDTSGNDRIRNILVRGNETYNTGTDTAYCCGAGILVKGYVVDAFIEYNYAHDNKGAAVFINGNESNHFGVGPTNIHLRYNILTNATNNGIIRVYDGSSPGDPKDLKIYGNLVYNNTTTGGLYLGSDLLNGLKLWVYNNTFYNAPVTLASSSATVTTFEFKNNIVHYTGGVPLTDASGRATAHSNNIYFGSGTLVRSGGTNYTASTLGTYEPTASASDPAFKSAANRPTGFAGTFGVNLAPNNDGLSLQQSSFGRDRGAALPAAYAGSINSVGRPASTAWDIGAYEFVVSGAPPTAPTGFRITN